MPPQTIRAHILGAIGIHINSTIAAIMNIIYDYCSRHYVQSPHGCVCMCCDTHCATALKGGGRHGVVWAIWSRFIYFRCSYEQRDGGNGAILFMIQCKRRRRRAKQAIIIVANVSYGIYMKSRKAI